MKKFIKELIPYIIIIIAVVLLRTFIMTPVIVVGDSMYPTLEDGNILLLNKLDYKFNQIERYDIVVIEVDNGEIIKRIIGLPGETVEYRDNILYINGKEQDTSKYDFDTKDFQFSDICNYDDIPKDYYLVLGDNRDISSDSRGSIGLINKKNIKGSVVISLWPISKIK